MIRESCKVGFYNEEACGRVIVRILLEDTWVRSKPKTKR